VRCRDGEGALEGPPEQREGRGLDTKHAYSKPTGHEEPIAEGRVDRNKEATQFGRERAGGCHWAPAALFFGVGVFFSSQPQSKTIHTNSTHTALDLIIGNRSTMHFTAYELGLDNIGTNTHRYLTHRRHGIRLVHRPTGNSTPHWQSVFSLSRLELHAG